LQVCPPSVERLVNTGVPGQVTPSEEISQTWWRRSKATAASLSCPHGPPEFPVVAGRNPWVQVRPPLFEVAKPMFEAPPPNTRPTWKAETIVLPKAKVSGSTSVRCWAWASVNGSALIGVSGTFAAADPAPRNSPATTTGGSRAAVRNLG